MFNTDVVPYVLKTPEKILLTLDRKKIVSTWIIAFSSADIISHYLSQ